MLYVLYTQLRRILHGILQAPDRLSAGHRLYCLSLCPGAAAVRKKLRPTPFDGLLALGILSLTLDGVTAWTANHPDIVLPMLNRVLHLLFLNSLDSIVFLLFLYFLVSTEGLPKRQRDRFSCLPPMPPALPW